MCPCLGRGLAFLGGSAVKKKKKLPANAGDPGSISESGRSPGEGNCNPLQWVGKSHGQRSPVGYSPWGCKEFHPLYNTHTIFFISLSFKSELLIALQTHCNFGLAAPLSMPLPVLVIPFFFTPLVAIYPSKPYSDTNITKVSSLVLHPLQLPSMN